MRPFLAGVTVLLLAGGLALAQSSERSEVAAEPAQSPQQESTADPAAGPAAGQSSVAAEIEVLERVLVTGEQPGPSLWEVTKDGHTLWILGTYDPLVEKMRWKSQQVESNIAASQRVVRWVDIDADLDVNFFSVMAALPSLIKAGNNPDRAKLKDVVPPAAYAQWQVLQAKYMPDEPGDKYRPSYAILRLRDQAMKTVGLTYEPGVWPQVQRLAKKHKVKIEQPSVKILFKVDKPRETLKKFHKIRLADVECFTQSLARLEDDLDTLRARANAWATGNVDVLREIPPEDPRTDCVQMLKHVLLSGELADQLGAREMVDRARADWERVHREQTELWLRTVEDAMRVHSSVFALVPIDVLLDKHGPLQTLRARGYEVFEP